jgi:protein-disulfide isomerase
MKLIINNDDNVQGKDTAPVTVIEYGDFECAYCGEAYPTIKEVKKIMADQICFVFRNFPLMEVHPHAQQAAYAAEAAAKQGKFWEMHDLLYENQNSLEDDDLLNYAKKLKLDTKQFKADMSSEKVFKKVKDDFMSGVRSGVNGTPTIFINGERHDGERDVKSLVQAILLAKKN